MQLMLIIGQEGGEKTDGAKHNQELAKHSGQQRDEDLQQVCAEGKRGCFGGLRRLAREVTPELRHNQRETETRQQLWQQLAA